MDATWACDMFNEALSKHPAPKIFNSNHGSQYTNNQHITEKLELLIILQLKASSKL